MSEMENIEIRVCLIGEQSIGKKSIISRFKILNTSQTVEESKKTEGTKKNELPKMDPFFSNKYIGREKTKLEKLINFTKILTISNLNIELKFFPISAADNIEFSDKINEEDEALREHKMKFDNIKSELEKVIMKQPTHPYAEVKILFLFVLDLENFEHTFDKLKIYHDELNKFLNIDKQYFKALIGNKVDIKNGTIDKEELNEFISTNHFHYYEISTKMFFNFEKFFERLFFDVFESTNASFSTNYFKERFNYVMSLRATFTRAERAPVKPNNYPGPQRYNSNVYNIEEVRPVFGKERFKNKIFVNKKGPIFDYKNEVFLKKQSKQSKSTKAIKRNQKLNSSSREDEDTLETAEKKKKLKEDMFGHNPGFSLGIKPSNLNIRKKKKEEYKKLMKSFEEIFDLDNITKEKVLQRSNSIDSFRISVTKRKEMMMKQKIEKFRMNRQKHQPKKRTNGGKADFNRKGSISERSERSSVKNITYENTFTSKTTKSMKANPTKRFTRAKSHRVVEKKEPFIVPGPAAYDVRGKIDLSKGFTFGGKYEINEMKNNYAPPYLYLESDIDIMLKQPKFAFKKGFAPRFKEQPVEIVGDTQEIENRLQLMEENKLNELNKKLNVLREREDKRDRASHKKEEQYEVYYRRLEEQIIKKEERENMKRITKGLKPIDYSTINYNLVEESAPMYTIKGRYEKGFLNMQENFDDPSKLHGLEQSVSYLSKNLTKNLNQLPNYSSVKQNLPSYSIPKAYRFEEEKGDKLPGPMSYFQDKYYEMESKPGSNKIAYMGTAKRYQDFRYSEVPGPGQYKIKGFSDLVVQEAERIRKRRPEGSDSDNRNANDMITMLRKEEDQSREIIRDGNAYDPKDDALSSGKKNNISQSEDSFS